MDGINARALSQKDCGMQRPDFSQEYSEARVELLEGGKKPVLSEMYLTDSPEERNCSQ